MNFHVLIPEICECVFIWSSLFKSILQPLMSKKLKLKSYMKTYNLLELTPKKDVLFIIRTRMQK